MKTRYVISWIARTLGIVFPAFVSLLALDVFGAGYGFWESILAFLIHLVPTFLLLIALLVAWRWPKLGALLYTALALLYIVMMRRDLDWMIMLLIPGPLLITGVLFGISGFLPRGTTGEP